MKPVAVLVGPPGAGKTTVAAALAARLEVDVRDTDHDIEAAAGCSVQDIFIDHGEAHFRELEEAAIAAALSEHSGVVALGGGAVLSAETRARLSGHSVIFLDVSLPKATSRVGMNSSRPLLLGNVRAQMKALMDHRRPLYREVARHTIDTDALTPDEVADLAAKLLEDNA